MPAQFSPLLLSVPQAFEWGYSLIYIGCACLVYLVLVKRASDEFPRKVIDAIFFIMLGAGALIWMLSKFPPIS